MNADKILARLEKLRGCLTKYEQEVEEDVWLPCWAINVKDLDAAINDIRAMDIAPSDTTRNIVIHDDGSFWYGARRLPKFIESDIRVWLEADDAPGGTDAK